MKKLKSLLAIGILLATAASVSLAQLSIEITGAGAQRMPIAVADFGGERVVSQALTSVIRSDLERSGRFNLVNTTGVAMDENTAPNYIDWKGRGADALAAGSLSTTPDGRYESRFRLYDTQKQVAIAGQALAHTSSQIRTTAHRIADTIYEKLTGERGIFSTRIAYVVKSPGRYELQIADADGNGAQSALASREPIISPAWSPDGKSVVYSTVTAPLSWELTVLSARVIRVGGQPNSP